MVSLTLRKDGIGLEGCHQEPETNSQPPSRFLCELLKARYTRHSAICVRGRAGKSTILTNP
jgi:hypothetical protein